MNNLNEMKSYFINIDEDELPSIIYDFVWDINEKYVSVNELYLRFAFEFMKVLTNSILLLEKNTTVSPMIFRIMDDLKLKVSSRIQSKFFGHKMKDYLINHPSKDTFEKNAILVYTKAIKYLDDWFDYEKTILKKLDYINLRDYNNYQLQFDKIVELPKLFNFNVDETVLFDEVCFFNQKIQEIQDKDSLPQDKLWTKIFISKNYSILQKVIECVMAIPVSNAFTERVFSIMKNLMTDERNQLDISLIKAELCIKLNYSMN